MSSFKVLESLWFCLVGWLIFELALHSYKAPSFKSLQNYVALKFYLNTQVCTYLHLSWCIHIKLSTLVSLCTDEHTVLKSRYPSDCWKKHLIWSQKTWAGIKGLSVISCKPKGRYFHLSFNFLKGNHPSLLYGFSATLKWYNICESAVQAPYKMSHVSNYYSVNIITSGHLICTTAGAKGIGWMDHEIKSLRYLESKGETNEKTEHHKVIRAEMITAVRGNGREGKELSWTKIIILESKF